MTREAISGQPVTARLPLATYRLQLHPALDSTGTGAQRRPFDFRAAQKVVPYLSRLGVDTLYLSPIWQSTPHSSHGYDVTDHTQISAELGGEKGLLRLHASAQEHGMGLLADFVPNHMGIAAGFNPYWEDVLKHGQGSRYAHFFDIAWQPLKRSLAGKVLLPTLGDQYGRVLERGELQLERRGGAFLLRYFERVFPLSPRSYAPILQAAGQSLSQNVGSHLLGLELASLAVQAANLPDSLSPLTDQARELRARETLVLERRIDTLSQQAVVQKALASACDSINSDPVALNDLIQQQSYRLSYWRVATEQINYRRFFDINDLAALRVEDPRVFEWAHSKLLSLLADRVLIGVRLDHTDGLYDPADYCRNLQQAASKALNTQEYIQEEGHEAVSLTAPQDASTLPLYVLAEKILEPGEVLPQWPIHGTTGYDFLAQVGGLFVEGQNEDEVSGIYRRFTGDTQSYGETLHETKMLIQRTSLASEVQVLAEQLQTIAEADLRWQDLTLSDLLSALRQVIACFPVYRTYLRPDGQREEGDNAKIEKALADARRYSRHLDSSVFDFLRAVLLLDIPDEASRERYTEFALKFQQLTGPVTAKGAEDTAFYRYGRLLSLNEVGGDPAIFGNPVRTFHAQCRERLTHWPYAMVAGSTHDTKRGEDTRARISVLSEMPQSWAAHLSHWSRLARPLAQSMDVGPAPSSSDLNILFQSALGIWPLGGGDRSGNHSQLVERLSAYMLKVMREAKARSSWARPDEQYEAATLNAVSGLIDNPEFVASMDALHQRISPYGAQNGLSATLLRLCAPGVPDTYQGSETWNQSLVDPDNRRPVDYTHLSQMLSRLEARHPQDPLRVAQRTLEHYETGEIKLLVTWAALQARREYPELFQKGDYQALSGGKHVVAFARHHQQHTLVMVAPRLTYTLTREQTPWALGEVWANRSLKLPSGRYRNVLTGEYFNVRGGSLALAKLLEFFPLALLLKES